MNPHIAAVVATYNRPDIVARLVKSLAAESSIGVICIVDNGSDRELKPALEILDRRVRYIDAGSNLGCGGGIALGMKNVLPDEQVTHVWILDDDAVIDSGCTEKLLAAMQTEKAEIAVPLMAGNDGNINSFPGPLKGRAWQEIKRPISPAQFVEACGNAPLSFAWSPGVCVLLSRQAFERCGLPRTDYWLMGEDIEYTCRLTAQFKAVLVTEARAHHLPPPPKKSQDGQLERYNFVKFCAHLTNTSYTAVNLPHGWRLLRHLPGNYMRFLRDYGWSGRTLARAGWCFLRGAVCRQPAGSVGFQKFKASVLNR